MVNLVCSGCGRSVDVIIAHGDEKCKECDATMAEVKDEESQEETKPFQTPDASSIF